MNKITTVGVDLAKSVFAVHGVDAEGRTMLRKTVRRDKVMELIVTLPPCLIGMEACGGAHEWARRFQHHGRRIGIMMARFVASYRKSSRNDGNDAEAIGEAAGRPKMRFVPVKSAEQQVILSLRRVRQGYVEQRTAPLAQRCHRMRYIHETRPTQHRLKRGVGKIQCLAIRRPGLNLFESSLSGNLARARAG